MSKKFQLKITKSITKKKTLLKKLYAADDINQLDISETNFSEPHDLVKSLNKTKFEYGYQRINLHVTDSHKEHPYFSLKTLKQPYNCFFSYMNCGQVAISVALFVLRKIHSNHIYLNESGLYYETFNFLSEFNFVKNIYHSQSQHIHENSILILDTSTEDIFTKSNLHKNIKAVVIDTTCVTLNDLRLNELIECLLKQKKMIVLVRSHIKIDCFGSEYNRLGSLFVIVPGEKSIRNIKQFREHMNEIAGPLGAIAPINTVYPFIKNKKFHSMNEKWVKKIQSANHSFKVKFLKEYDSDKSLQSILEPVFFEHNLFCWLKFKSLDFDYLMQVTYDFIQSLHQNKIPALQIASYPWDFIALSNFLMTNQMNTEEKNCVLRVSIGPNDKSEIDKFLIGLITYLQTRIINHDQK